MGPLGPLNVLCHLVETRPTLSAAQRLSFPVMHDGGVSALSGPVPVSETVSVWNLP